MELYTTCGTKSYKLMAETMQKVMELPSGQEEADAHLLLYAKHATTPHVKAVIISSEDTDNYYAHTMHIICSCNFSSYLSEMCFTIPGQVC